MENQRYFIPDIESGTRTEVTKEQYEAYIKMWEHFRPKIEGVKGIITIVGTSGELDNNEDLKNIFYTPENYNYKE